MSGLGSVGSVGGLGSGAGVGGLEGGSMSGFEGGSVSGLECGVSAFEDGAMIEFENVCACYADGRPVLHEVGFSLRRGEFVALVGTNGAGKSTAMRLVNGLLTPSAGEVRVDGVPTSVQSTSALARRVGFLFQNPDRQICCPTVREELLFGFKAQGRLDAAARARVDATLEEFGLGADEDPFLLSRGARQLLALASVTVMEPEVLVLDEPTTGLDARECALLMGVVARMHRAGATVLMVSHDMELVAEYAQRCIVMAEGRVLADGPVREVLRDRDALARASLVPPQIVDVALRLSESVPGVAGTALSRASTVDEMAAAIEEALRRRGGVFRNAVSEGAMAV